MKKAVMYLVVFIILCLSMKQGINYSLGKQIKNQSPFSLSFASSGVNLLESRLDCWAKININSTSKDLDSNLIHMLQHLRLPIQKQKFIHNQDKELAELHYQCRQNEINYDFVIRSDHRYKETYYIVTMVTKEDTPELRNQENNLKKIMDFNFYYLYSGKIENLYDQDSQKKLISNIMKNLDAKVIEEYKDEKAASMTGYSKTLEKWVEPLNSGDEKYNLQAAIRSNSKNRTTEVYLGSPLILGDY